MRPASFWTAPLLTNGGVGAVPKVVPNDPESIPPQQYNPLVGDGIQVGDRLVGFSRAPSHASARCWTSSGPAVRVPASSATFPGSSITDETDPGSNSVATPRDDSGSPGSMRAFVRSGAPCGWSSSTRKRRAAHRQDVRRSCPRLLDTARAGLRRPLPGGHTGHLGGDIFTWAPGERSATRMGRGRAQIQATLLDEVFPLRQPLQ